MTLRISKQFITVLRKFQHEDNKIDLSEAMRLKAIAERDIGDSPDPARQAALYESTFERMGQENGLDPVDIASIKTTLHDRRGAAVAKKAIEKTELYLATWDGKPFMYRPEGRLGELVDQIRQIPYDKSSFSVAETASSEGPQFSVSFKLKGSPDLSLDTSPEARSLKEFLSALTDFASVRVGKPS